MKKSALLRRSLWRLLVILVVWSAKGTAQTPTATAFVGVNVVPMDRDTVLERQTVVVDSGRIVALGPAAIVPVPAHAAIVQAEGQYLIPGLADMHAHIGYPAVRTSSTLDSGVVHELLALVANGVTVIRDMHSGGRPGRIGGTPSGDDSWRLRLRDQIAAGEILGPRLYTTGDPDESSPAAAAKSVEALKAAGHDFVKVSADAGAEAGRLYDSIVAAAARVNIPVVGHVPPVVGVDGVVRARQRSIEHLDRLPEHMLGLQDYFIPGPSIFQDAGALLDTAAWMAPTYQLDTLALREMAQTLARAGVWVCPTLDVYTVLASRMTGIYVASNSRADRAAASAKYMTIRMVFKRYSAFLLPITKALSDAGVGLLLGTDMNFFDVVPGFSVADELRLLVQAGLSPYQALETTTRNVAVFLHQADSAGTIAVGKRADLVLLAGNPLRDINAVRGPAGVVLGGRYFSREALDARLDALPAPNLGDLGMRPEVRAKLYETVRMRRTQAWVRPESR